MPRISQWIIFISLLGATHGQDSGSSIAATSATPATNGGSSGATGAGTPFSVSSATGGPGGATGGGSAGTTPSPCNDKHPLCKFWGSIGDCNNNPSYMSINCADTCFTCDALIANQQSNQSADPNCADKYDLCDFWAKADQCYEKEAFMAQSCKSSCGTCKNDCVACPPGVDFLPVFQERPVRSVDDKYEIEEKRRALLRRLKRSACFARPTNPGCSGSNSGPPSGGPCQSNNCPARPSISLFAPPKLHFAPKCCFVAAKSADGTGGKFGKKFAPQIKLTLSKIKSVSGGAGSATGSPGGSSPGGGSAPPTTQAPKRKFLQ